MHGRGLIVSTDRECRIAPLHILLKVEVVVRGTVT